MDKEDASDIFPKPEDGLGIEKGPVPVRSDRAFNANDLGAFDKLNLESLQTRDDQYSNILDEYHTYISGVLQENFKRQKWFFWISLLILVLSPLQFLLILFSKHQDIVSVLASVTEAVGALLIFPKIIAEYLFNTGETTSINDVVTSIQNYDIEVRRGIRHTIESMTEEKE